MANHTPSPEHDKLSTLWIESHIEIGRHPKTRALARQAGISIPTAVGHLHLLWHFAMEFAPDGDLSRFAPDDIEGAIMWDGDVTVMYRALWHCGWLDVDDHDDDDVQNTVHDWPIYAGRLLEQREKNREKQRRYRERQSGDGVLPIKEESANDHVTVTSPSRNPLTVPNRTVTVPNQTEEERETHVSLAAKTPRVVERNETWDSLAAMTGEPGTKTERSDFAKTVRELVSEAATPEQIQGFPPWWWQRFPDATLTHRCYRGHWGEYLTAPARPTQLTDLSPGMQAIVKFRRDHEHDPVRDVLGQNGDIASLPEGAKRDSPRVVDTTGSLLSGVQPGKN